MTAAAHILADKLGSLKPEIAIVLGSGLGPLAEEVENPLRIAYAQLPGFPQSGVSGHAGEIVAGTFGGRPVLLLAGRAHYYEHGDAAVMRPALETLVALGIQKLILTNAAGSLRTDIPPGSVMLITDHINFAGVNPLFGERDERRFVGMTEAYDATLREAIEQAAQATRTPLSQGVYMWFSGPSFETPAEIRMARVLGADAVGMSTVPEVILARFLGLRVAACSVVTNLGAGMTGSELSHQETKDMAPIGGARLATILKHALGNGLLA